MGLTIDWDKYNKVLQEDLFKVRGRVVNVVGLTTESKGPQAKLGDICLISSRNGGTEEKPVQAEVVGFKEGKVLLMPYDKVEGRSHIHVRMTVVTGMLPKSVERIVQIIVSITIAATCFILLPNAYKIFLSQSKLKAVTLGISLGIEYIAAPVGIFMMAIQWTVDALYAIFDWPGYQARYVKEEQ